MDERKVPAKGPVTVLVVAGVVAAALAGIGMGVDPRAATLFVCIVLAGWLGIAVARRSHEGRVEPKLCPECRGLNATSAPYCKHCGAAF